MAKMKIIDANYYASTTKKNTIFLDVELEFSLSLREFKKLENFKNITVKDIKKLIIKAKKP